MLINSGNLQTLNRGFSAAFLEGFEGADTDYEMFTMVSPSGAATTEYSWLGQFPGLIKWLGERIVKGIVSHGYSITNETYEATLAVKRTDIEDDQYGAYGKIFAEAGRAAMDHRSQLIYAALKAGFETKCYDGQFFFDTDHPVYNMEGAPAGTVSNDGGGNGEPWFLFDASRMVKPMVFQDRLPAAITQMTAETDEPVFMLDEYRYGVRARCNVGYGFWQMAYGSKQTLNAASYKAARAAMRGFVGDRARVLGIKPTHLVVGPALEENGLEILNAEQDAAGASNVWARTAELIVSPWLA